MTTTASSSLEEVDQSEPQQDTNITTQTPKIDRRSSTPYRGMTVLIDINT